MLGDDRLRRGSRDYYYVRRVVRAFDRRRIGAVALVTLLLSVGPYFSPDFLGFFSPAEIVLDWLEHFVELAVLAAALTTGYTLLDEALQRRSRLRVPILCAMLFGLSFLLTLLLFAYYAHGFDHPPPLLRLLADSLRFGLPAIFLALIADAHQRALHIDAAAHVAEMWRSHLVHDETDQQLALLQAQIEPHFLFNVLGNVRRLYRTQPQVGSTTIVSLMRYLRAALPQMRGQNRTLGDELDLVRAYLDLFKVRMGARLTFSIEVHPTLHEFEFPSMLLVTLVENAIKHGLEPAGGGSVCVRARRYRDRLELAVLDDGAGFGAAASSGTGVGLANVRRQLMARYQSRARLMLDARAPRGASATIVMPLRIAATTDPDHRALSAA